MLIEVFRQWINPSFIVSLKENFPRGMESEKFETLAYLEAENAYLTFENRRPWEVAEEINKQLKELNNDNK